MQSPLPQQRLQSAPLELELGQARLWWCHDGRFRFGLLLTVQVTRRYFNAALYNGSLAETLQCMH